ncbi:MAG: enolase C-terminal domain-like protein [Planctomycetota bacterium]
MNSITIQDVETIITRPTTENLVVVRVRTSEPGLHGLGCATFTQRATAVAEVIGTYLRPLLVGHDVARISELWRLMHVNGYWRGGPVLMNAISGIDQALWDIKGRVAAMPVYDLIGGRVREAAAIYQHVAGPDASSIVGRATPLIADGVGHLRIQIASDTRGPDELAAANAGYGGANEGMRTATNALAGAYFDPNRYVASVLQALAKVREQLPDHVQLIHDVHSRLTVRETVAFAKQLEPFRLFFLEDSLPPEHLNSMRLLRDATVTPLAIGELFTSRSQWLPLVREGLIDFLRLHVSAVGGFTPAWEASQLCEAFGVQTAWHGPKDTSPIGHAAQLHLDVASPAFGVQEFSGFTDAEHEIFRGLPELKSGYLYPSQAPGWGIELDDAAARRFPPIHETVEWTQARRPDGSLSYP